MNYYELIYLKTEFKNKLRNCVLDEAITPYKNLLELYMSNERESFRLIFSSTPGNTTLFLDTYRPGKKSNKLLFFEELYGYRLVDIHLAEHDRLLSFVFENGQKIVFKLFSNKANVLEVSEGNVVEVFKDHGEIGEREPVPKKQFLFNAIPKKDTPKKMLLASNPILPRGELEALIRYNELDQKVPEEVFGFAKQLTDQLKNDAEFRKLADGSVTLISEDFFPVSTSERFGTVNELIAHRFKNYAHTHRLSQRKGSYRKIITRQLKRLGSVLNNLTRADKGIEKADLYEKYGHLLMANAHLSQEKSDSILVADLYDEGKELKIEINANLSLAENAEYYYDRASNSLKSYEEALSRLPKIKERTVRLERMRSELEEINHLRDFDEWKKKHKKEIENLEIGKSKKEVNNLPFHNLEIKGYQIWIGKNAKSNDKLVQLSHKEDIWMHARGVPGSHLIIRMANSKSIPPKEVLEKAAAYAAYNSKAKGSDLVPVIVTKRKFVRKPKGAALGAVLVQKEEVELVKPEKPIL
ncbi:MAG: NFACT family protein [Balneolaceae bacterium]